MSKGRKTGIIICSVLIAATLAFIWGNSAVSKAESAEESGKVYGVFAEFFNAIFGEGVITHKIFRKIAHFSEYALLGVEIYALISLTLGIRPLVVLSSFQFGLYAAVIDESIQILSEKGRARFGRVARFLRIRLRSGVVSRRFSYRKSYKTQ